MTEVCLAGLKVVEEFVIKAESFIGVEYRLTVEGFLILAGLHKGG